MKKYMVLPFVLSAMTLSSCTTSQKDVPPESVKKDRVVQSDRTNPFQSSLDFPLYKNESYYHGSKDAELESFVDGGHRVQTAQQKIADSVKGNTEGDKKRVFHTKSHGCYLGKLNLLKQRPADTTGATSVGMFDPKVKDSYDVIVRFSNGVGVQQDDKLPDVRGMAIKVIDVVDSKTGKTQNVDFLMTNSPTPFGKDFLEFVEFMEYVADNGPTLGAILFSPHFRASKALIKASGLPVISNYKIKSLATQRYWSGHPYLLGPNMAMKFNVRPTETSQLSKKDIKKMKDLADNYLSIDMGDRLKAGSIKFKFGIQLEKDTKSTPIEDNLVEWKEKVSPSIDVAELVIDRQSDPNTGSLRSSCEKMRFTPGHYITDHRPLSNMGRGRLFAYEASQIGRLDSDKKGTHVFNPGDEPTSKDIQQWKQLNIYKDN